MTAIAVSVYLLIAPIVRIATIGLALGGLWAALRRTTLPAKEIRSSWATVALLLVAWGGIVWALAAADFFQSVPGHPSPRVPLAILLPIVLSIPLLLRSRVINTALFAAPPAWLIGFQVYRVMG